MTTLLALAALGSAHASTEVGEGRPFGLGVQLGQPFGLTGKVYLGGRANAIDFTIGTYYSRGY